MRFGAAAVAIARNTCRRVAWLQSANASQQSQGSTGDPSSAKRSAPVRFTPAPRSDADVALDFVPIASQPPTPDGHVSLDLRDGIERDGGWGTRGVVYGAGVVTGVDGVDDGGVKPKPGGVGPI